MTRQYRFKEQALALHDREWSVDEDVYLIENQDEPVEYLATYLQMTVDEVSTRRQRLGLIRRAKAIIRLREAD